MLYEGLGATGRYGLGVAFSPDAVVWARSPRNPVGPLGACAVNQELSAVHPFLLQADRLLYYVEVLHARSDAPHRICATRLRDERLVCPSAQARLDLPLWRQEQIGPEGRASAAIPTEGYSRVTFAVAAGAEGQVEVELDAEGLGAWQVAHSQKVAAGRLTRGTCEDIWGRLRLRFAPERPAKCDAWLSLRR